MIPTKSSQWSSVRVRGVRVDDVTRANAVQIIESFIRSGKPHFICTTNADMAMQAQRDGGFRDVLNAADLAISDGLGIVRAARVMGFPLRENVGGRLLLIDFCQLAAKRGYSVFFLGSLPGVAARAAEVLRARFPGLRVAGTYSPPYLFEGDPSENEKVLAIIREAHPDALFVALGAPRQEKWTYRHLAQMGVPACMVVGSSFDVISGHVKGAPAWMTERGLEWAFRLAHEPRRLGKRYLGEARFAALAVKEGLANKLGLRVKKS